MSSANVEKIKERLGIEEVISSYIKLERAGKNLKGKCPFHNEKTPSFFVSPDRGSYYCFGCGAKGDIFSFVEQFEGLDFMGALKLLADRAGVELEFNKVNENHRSEKEKLFAIMEDATVFFEKGLEHSPEAREYLQARGLSHETIKKFRIGYIPADWRLLHAHLTSKKYSDSDIEKAGLIKKPDNDDASTASGTQPRPTRYYDRFRGRVMFPIADSSGRIIAFSGRILVDDGKSAKYLNSPDTVLFNKSTVLYGIDKAKNDIRIKDYSILVEGQMDLVLSHQAGIRNTVAVSGTALSDTLTSKDNVVNNLGIVKRLSNNVIMAFDSDAAGHKAAMRSAAIALSLGMDVKIASLPEGKDPADLVLKNPDEWKHVLRSAKAVIEFEMESIIKDMEQGKIQARNVPKIAQDRLYPLIETLPQRSAQDYHIKIIREHLFNNIESEEAIRKDIEKIRLERIRKQGSGQETSTHGIVTPAAQESRLDLISRKLFGLLAYLAHNNILDAESAYARIKDIVGDDRFNNLIHAAESSRDERLLEAEILFGSHKDTASIKRHIDEMLARFEEDIVRQEFAEAMSALTKAERAKDEAQAKELIVKIDKLTKRMNALSQKI